MFRRSTMLLTLLLLIGGLVAAGLTGSPVSAQDATPAAGQWSTTPDDCTNEPRSLEEVQAIAGTPAPEGAGEATEVALSENPPEVELPAGDPAEQAAVDGITATIIQLVACYNAGHYLAGFAGVTEEFLQSQVGLALFDEDFVAVMTADPVALEEALWTQLVGIREATLHEDGRVGVLVDTIAQTPEIPELLGPETDLWIFELVEGVWLLDETIPDLEDQYGPDVMATPAG